LGLKARPSPVNAKEPKPAPRPKEPDAKPVAKAPSPRSAPKSPPPEPVVAPDVGKLAAITPSQPLPGRGADVPRVVSVGPGGFLRQGPGDQQAPIPPAPPRRLVPAKPSPEIADKTSLL